MPTLKDLGNQAFKNKRYKEAIKYYEEYVVDPHSDNKNAYFNLGLCYSKLQDHIKSIEACKSAVVIDPNYQKAYYRLMKQYVSLGNSYEVFINALQYIKTEKDQQCAQIVEAKQFLKFYKQRFLLKADQLIKPKKLQQSNQIFGLIDCLKPTLGQNPEFDQQIDKQPVQWIDEWGSDIQSQDAKLEEIAYIMRDIDYNYGLSLAYYYRNQLKSKKKRNKIDEKIKQIKLQLNIFCETTQLESKSTREYSSSEQSNQQFQKKTDTQKISKNIVAHADTSIKIENNPKKAQKLPKINKFQQMLESKSSLRKGPPAIQNEQPAQVKQIAKQKNLTNSKINTAPKQGISKFVVPQKEPQLEQLYTKYCGSLQKTKDVFTEVYKSIYSILSGRDQSSVKGDLLILLKKRVKKFKLIVDSFSANEQDVIFDLLKKNKIEEYAVDFAPTRHTI